MTIPLPVIPNVFRVALRWRNTVDGRTAVNVMHFQATPGPLTPDNVYTILNANWTSGMVAVVQFSSLVSAVDILPLDGTSATQTFSGFGPSGSGSGDYVPQVSVIAKFSTGLRGRANRGRIFLPFVAEQFISNGAITQAEADSMTAAWATFRTNLITAHLDPVVAAYDRVHSGAGAHASLITNIVVETFTATQRRRQPGRKVARHRHVA
jgi:hypothetical protein